MDEIVDVNTGELAVRRGAFTLRAVALGSCIAVVAYDAFSRIAGMAHIMLPGGGTENGRIDTRYADWGIDALLNQMREAGGDPKRIEVCLIGAGNVLRNENDTICSDNIRSVTEILRHKGIPIRASRVGGNERKSAFVDALTGRVSFTEGNGDPQPLWMPKSGNENLSVW